MINISFSDSKFSRNNKLFKKNLRKENGKFGAKYGTLFFTISLNPRKDKWQEHFDVIEGMILSKTAIAQVTERIFKFNEIERLIFRRQVIQQNQYKL